MPRRALASTALIAAMIAPSTAPAAEPAQPPAGSHGFDWLHPESARCLQIGPKLRARFKRCTYDANGGFTGTVPAYTCSVSGDIEYQVFVDRATCEAQLETMQGNAP